MNAEYGIYVTDLGSFPGRGECSQWVGDFQMPICAPAEVAAQSILPLLLERVRALNLVVPEELSVEGYMSYVVVNSVTHEPLFQCVLKPSPISDEIEPLHMEWQYRNKLKDQDLGHVVVQIEHSEKGTGFDVSPYTGSVTDPEWLNDMFAEAWELRGHDTFWEAFKAARSIALRCRDAGHKVAIDFEPVIFEY